MHMCVRVYFRGGQGGAFAPLGIDLPPLGNWLSLYLIWGAPPLRIWICPLLKFATMHLPPLERNPEINPVCAVNTWTTYCRGHTRIDTYVGTLNLLYYYATHVFGFRSIAMLVS